MPRYIDADALIEALQGWREDSAMYDGSGNPVDSILYDVICRTEDAPTADVAPRAELEQLRHKYELAVAEREANAKALVDMTIERDSMRTAANSYKMHYQNVAREIFAEIEKCTIRKVTQNGEILFDSTEQFAELKKKYMEATDGRNV